MMYNVKKAKTSLRVELRGVIIYPIFDKSYCQLTLQ
jgi:hypothetical protein